MRLILSGKLDSSRVEAFYNRLKELEPRYQDIFVQLKSRDKKRFHFSRHTLGQYGTNITLQETLLEEAEIIAAPLIQSLQGQLPRHTVADVSVLMSHPGAKSQVKHKDWNSRAVDNLKNDEMPCSVMVPLNAFCVLDIYDESGKCVVSQHVNVGFFAQFRGDTLHAGGANILSFHQFRLHIYLTTPNTPVPNDVVFTV
jgi:hypothetical protein